MPAGSHFHDLWCTGNEIAAASTAGTRWWSMPHQFEGSPIGVLSRFLPPLMVWWPTRQPAGTVRGGVRRRRSPQAVPRPAGFGGAIFAKGCPAPDGGTITDRDGALTDQLSMIVQALATGAAAAAAGVAGSAVSDGYGVLKSLIRQRFQGREQARQALELDATDSALWLDRIGADLQESGAAEDQEVLAAARELLLLADPGNATNFHISGPVNGAVGQFHAPLTFDQRTQLPPVAPTAQ